MHSLKRLLLSSSSFPSLSIIPSYNRTETLGHVLLLLRRAHSTRSPSSSSSSSSATGDDEWNDAWEMAWLPEDPSSRDRAPWESSDAAAAPADMDADTKAFVAEMDERWNERRAARKLQQGTDQSADHPPAAADAAGSGAKSAAADDYRVRKQRIHAGLWMKEIEKMEEAKLGGPGAGDDIDRLLDSCSEIFDSGNMELGDSKIPNMTEFKTNPDGWETTSKNQDGNIWEITQREEDILLQEFERRIAFSKFQIASFVKTHIFSRRRPIDGWKYMIEEIGPNARRGKGSVQRLPSITDASTQPYKEEKPAIGLNLNSRRGR
uniref:Mucin-related protein n=1 Tax=Ananas comosus var. bracteatus TaxID=296719 RepID=A0A6V7QUI2_ANACO